MPAKVTAAVPKDLKPVIEAHRRCNGTRKNGSTRKYKKNKGFFGGQGGN
jgi:hypothetical protein